MTTILKTDTKNLLKKALIDSLGDESKFDQICDYFTFLIDKNNELNLISRKLSINDVINGHIFDCMAGFKYFNEYKSICDIGSGGGLPGLLLAVVFNDKKIKLIEKSSKKVKFLQDASKILNLKNTEIIEGLVEKQKINDDIITCRAFKSVREILQMTKKYFNSNGKYLIYKARIDKIHEEINDAKIEFSFNFDIIKLKQIVDKERHLILFNKN
ncbi:MAG: 16S rRNA (guanine(527)-N(7))-methyltransferase RsmG [Spirochaetes bacterium]|nr:16S rRNA (guanine(527)-N(7))-methyltransferase RsmG [Spirochaetota bacterium]